VRAAERGQEVVERGLVGDVDGGDLEAPLVLVGVEQIVISHADIEQMAGSDAGRVTVVVFGAGCGQGD